MDLLLERPPWFLVGPFLGLIVVAVFATLNERLGVLGGYGELVERALGTRRSFGWKAWFVIGIAFGGVVFGLASGRWQAGAGYGWLQQALGNDPLATGALLAAGGMLIGVGAKTAGGCTSGNGLAGCSFGSPASVVATGTFMASAVGTAFLFRWLLG
ncbi:MAG: YeeE/YedE family protein [Gaiellaceae bacterium]